MYATAAVLGKSADLPNSALMYVRRRVDPPHELSAFDAVDTSGITALSPPVLFIGPLRDLLADLR